VEVTDRPEDDLGERAVRLLQSARATAADLEQFVSSARAELRAADGAPAVTADFDDSGVLSALRIDDDARRQLTEQQLVAQLDAALLGGPAPHPTEPHAVAARMDALLDSLETGGPSAAPRVETTTPDGTLTLVSVHGRPVGIRPRPGWLLSEPSDALAAAVVSLAREAASRADDRKGSA
jgi:hypothetical protein